MFAGVEGDMTLDEMTPDERRRCALGEAYKMVGASLLRDQAPDAEAFALLVAAVVDAAISGDRAVLAAARDVVRHLQRLEPRDAPRLERWRGRLEALAAMADLADHLLLIERYVAE